MSDLAFSQQKTGIWRDLLGDRSQRALTLCEIANALIELLEGECRQANVAILAALQR
jgi:hypothetical protein